MEHSRNGLLRRTIEKISYYLTIGEQYAGTYLEKTLRRMPGYLQNQDEIFEECLGKIISGEKLSRREEFKLGWQHPSGKTVWLIMPPLYAVSLYVSSGKPLPTAIGAGLAALFGMVHDSGMGARVKRIYNRLSEEDRKDLQAHLEKGEMDDARMMLYENGW